MLKNVPISLSGPVMNIKLALKLCHFDILISAFLFLRRQLQFVL